MMVILKLNGIMGFNMEEMTLTQVAEFLGVSKKVDTAVGMGMAVTFVMTISSALTYIVQTYLLAPYHMEYLQTVAFILIIAALVQFVEMFLQKVSPSLYSALGIYLPLITTNCAVLGSALIIVDPANGYNMLESIVFGASAGIGFTVAILLFAGVRERLETADIPKPLQGFPIALISAALLSLAFLGFQGLKF